MTYRQSSNEDEPGGEIRLPYSTLKRTPLKRGKYMKKRKRHKEVEIGKLGIVRLKGEAMTELRWACYVRDGGICQSCGRSTPWERGNLAHIKGKRNHGDALENVRWLCACYPSYCHQREHSGTLNGKPCPPKPKVESC